MEPRELIKQSFSELESELSIIIANISDLKVAMEYSNSVPPEWLTEEQNLMLLYERTLKLKKLLANLENRIEII